jgi:hypothetical protein
MVQWRTGLIGVLFMCNLPRFSLCSAFDAGLPIGV